MVFDGITASAADREPMLGRRAAVLQQGVGSSGAGDVREEAAGGTAAFELPPELSADCFDLSRFHDCHDEDVDDFGMMGLS